MKNKVILCVLTIFAIASIVKVTPVRADSFQDMLNQQQELTQKINENRSSIADLQDEINRLDDNIASNQAAANEEARMVQVSNPTNSFINMLFSSRSLSEVIQRVASITLVVSATNQRTNDLKAEKDNQEKALDKLNAVQIELAQQEQSMRSSVTTYTEAVDKGEAKTPTVPPVTQNSNDKTVDLGTSDEQARANIVFRESSGNYSASNGRYYGAYQLDISYLNGDLSPANQDAVAQNYVTTRYGSWSNAWAFWQSHGWY